MGDAAGAGNNGRKNNTNNQGSVYTNSEEEMTTNTNLPRNTRNRHVKFSKTRRIRPIKKANRARPVGNRAKTRAKGVYHNEFPDEENVLAMIQSSSWNSRIASESARIFANHETLEDMLRALNAKPINRRVKERVRETLERKFHNLNHNGANRTE
jgi:hypothetical protein